MGRHRADLVTAIGHKPFQAGLPQTLRLRRNPAEQKHFRTGRPLIRHHPGSLGHDAHRSTAALPDKATPGAINDKRRQRPVIIEQQDASRSGTQPLQKRTVSGVTFEHLDAGS